MLRKLTITTTLALALLGFASCGGRSSTPENPVEPPPAEDPCATPGETEAPDDPSAASAAAEPCPEPQAPDVCNSGPDKRCPDHQNQ